MRRLFSLSVAFIVLSLAVAGLATTWGKTPTPCGLCGKSVDTESIMSYGSYIYGWPSKYQLIFWPATESRSLYHCKHCGFTALMGDFKKIPKEKKKAVGKAVKPLFKKHKHKRYYQVPMDYRLKIAEAVYKVLERDDNFWCRFYRIQGYHLEKQGKLADAQAARVKALGLAEKMLEAGKKKPIKEFTTEEYREIFGVMQESLIDKFFPDY